MDTQYTFCHVCSFTSQPNNMGFERRTCEFEFVCTDEESGEQKVLAKIEDVDMSSYVGKQNKYRMLKFRDCEFPNTFVKLTWTIKEYTK